MIETFGTFQDETVRRIRISSGALTAHVLTWGAVVQDLRLEGHAHPLVLGFAEFAPYPAQSPFFGAIAGRCANRIRDGHLELDGAAFQLDRNFIGKHTLHGGADSMGKRIWQIADNSADSVTLTITLPDGHNGFPGTLTARATYAVSGSALVVRLEAETDAPTLCNLAHHSYFNLDGAATLANHRLQIDAETFLPVDDELIPTGEQRPVGGTVFDFRTPRPALTGTLLDHNFCLSPDRRPIRPVAHLSAGEIAMEIRTTEPGLQVYDGANIATAAPGLAGGPMGAHAGIALEPQVWPDANHHSGFPQAVLRPGEAYHQLTEFHFTGGR